MSGPREDQDLAIPEPNTWHAVGKHPLNGAIRTSIIINYVTSAWLDKFELA
jgi:hypothetical protein